MIGCVVCPHHTSNHASQVFSAQKFGCVSLQSRPSLFLILVVELVRLYRNSAGTQDCSLCREFLDDARLALHDSCEGKKRASSKVLGTNGRFRVHWWVLFVLIIWIVSARCLTRRRAKSESVPVEQDDMFGKNGSREVAPARQGGGLVAKCSAGHQGSCALRG